MSLVYFPHALIDGLEALEGRLGKTGDLEGYGDIWAWECRLGWCPGKSRVANG